MGASSTSDDQLEASIRADKEGFIRLLTVLDEMNLLALERVQTILLSWERKYHSLWDQDIDAYMRWVFPLPPNMTFVEVT